MLEIPGGSFWTTSGFFRTTGVCKVLCADQKYLRIKELSLDNVLISINKSCTAWERKEERQNESHTGPGLDKKICPGLSKNSTGRKERKKNGPFWIKEFFPRI